MRSPKKLVGEMWSNFDVSRSSWFGPSWNALRGMFTDAFFKKPIMQGSVVNYDLARSLYRSGNDDYRFGAGFVRPIIDLSVEYIDLPSVSGTENDAYLNECITDYWAPQLQQMLRDAMRDSKVIVRYRQPSLQNPLFTEADRVHGKLEIIPPEEVDLTYDPSDPELLERAAVTHFIDIDERTDEEVVRGTAPRLTTHEILEIITPDAYKFFDKTAGEELGTWMVTNAWGFVPIWEVFNEYAADLGGGQSDIEPMLTFIQAFHEVLVDALSAHKYHSIPKAKFKLKDVTQFLKNNFPDVLDPATGRPKEGAKINLSGREIYFFSPDEDADFIQAKSVLGDSKTLLEFIIDCICITAETPRWALLAQGNALPETDASVQPFEKKIARKRTQFLEPIVMICKMALAANGKLPTTPTISWPSLRISELVNKGQALQQIVLAFDVAAAHGWMADKTIVQILGTLFDEVADPEQEMKAAETNKVIEPPAAPPSDTQAIPPAKSTGTNGTGSKAAGKKAVATTAASRS
jgi:hypothetical protein